MPSFTAEAILRRELPVKFGLDVEDRRFGKSKRREVQDTRFVAWQPTRYNN